MDSYEATKIVFSRIQALDPENASKITGYVLIQEHGEKEMIRLAFGPESLLRALILKAKTHLGISSPSPLPSPISRPFPPPLRVNSFSNLPASPSSSPWQQQQQQLPVFSPSSSSPSYAAAVIKGSAAAYDCGSNGSTISTAAPPTCSLSSSSSSSVGSSLAYCNSINSVGSSQGELFDEYCLHEQQQQQLSFLADPTTTGSSSPSMKFDSFSPASAAVGGNGGFRDQPAALPHTYGIAWSEAMAGAEVNPHTQHPHRRSLSLSDACFGSDDLAAAGFGWRPCLYFARGFCKNGSSCKFVHGGGGGGYGDAMDSPTSVVGSPGRIEVFEQCQEMLRSKVIAQQQQQRLAAAIAGASFPYNKCMNLLMNDAQRFMMSSEELQQQKFGRWKPERSDFCGIGGVNPGSRQIYLTFPADSTFREEDVSNYFSIYGPVQDVRIPYQQKRMFGFVTFVYPETVKLILAKGNPHFVCDSRVLVKPYKEKGKVPDKNKLLLHQQRGDYSTCSSPTAIDSREAYEIHPCRYYGAQEMILRKKLEEQADLQHAIDLQGRRLLNLQLLDLKNNHSMFMGGGVGGGRGVSFPFPSPTQLPFSNPHSAEENGIAELSSASVTHNLEEGGGIHESSSSFAHVLPDNLFSSPTKKSTSELSSSPFSSNPAQESDVTLSPPIPTSDSPAVGASLPPNKPCSFHLPRISSGQGAIEM